MKTRLEVQTQAGFTLVELLVFSIDLLFLWPVKGKSKKNASSLRRRPRASSMRTKNLTHLCGLFSFDWVPSS
jgi:hypothetical protein